MKMNLVLHFLFWTYYRQLKQEILELTEKAKKMRFHYRAAVAMINLLVGILRGMEEQGSEHIPAQGAVLIAANHIAYFDPPLIGSASPRELYYMAKKELFENSLFGWLISKFNAFPISRGSGSSA